MIANVNRAKGSNNLSRRDTLRCIPPVLVVGYFCIDPGCGLDLGNFVKGDCPAFWLLSRHQYVLDAKHS